MEEIYKTADVYIEANNLDKAQQFEQTVISKWPKTNSAINAQLGLVKIHFTRGSSTDVDAALDTLVADYNNNTQLPRTFQHRETLEQAT